MPVTGGGDANFEVGAEVEVSTRGAFFPATIIGKGSRATIFTVEYKTLKARSTTGRNKRKALKEEVDMAVLRPSPPRERSSYAFEPGDEVDAFYNDGWREGVIAITSAGSSKFSVYLRDLKRQLDFECPELRLHREWVSGKWVPPLEETIVSASKEAKAIKQEELSEGTLVEVRSDEEGFRGSWYAAKVVKVEGQDKYLVQFKGLRTDGDKEFLKEKVDKQNIRPYPPEAIIVDGFDLNEKVDAFFNDGWWEGVICKILKGGRYKVYFKESDEELVFEHCDLRPHQDWINETWVMASQRLNRI